MEKENLFEKIIETRAGKIYYYLGKNFPNRPTALFLHGLSANHTTWESAARALSGLGVNCLMPDLRGHGYSDKKRKKSLYKFEILSQDLKMILEKEGVGKALVVGYSFGGALAFDFCLRYPELCSGAVFISANHVNPISYWRVSFISPLARAFVWLISYLLIWQKMDDYAYYHPQASHGYWSSVWRGFKTMPLSVNLWLLLMMGRLNFKGKISAIKVPALIVRGRHDPFVTQKEAREIMESLPRAEEIVTENKNHFLATESEEEITKIIVNFIKKHGFFL